MNDPRQHAPATLRNRDFILGILRDVLPTKGVILEIASGSGEHVVHFAGNLPNLVFQPSDREPDALQSVAARWRDVRRPIGRRSSRIGKAWGPNTRWVRRLPCRQERPTKALERALTASGRKSGLLAADDGLRGL